MFVLFPQVSSVRPGLHAHSKPLSTTSPMDDQRMSVTKTVGKQLRLAGGSSSSGCLTLRMPSQAVKYVCCVCS